MQQQQKGTEQKAMAPVVVDTENHPETQDGNAQNTEETNPYLALRAAKIARNEARLQQLGLGTNKATTTAAIAIHYVATGKRKRPSSAHQGPSPLTERVLRRSARRTVRPDTYWVPPASGEAKHNSSSSSRADQGPAMSVVATESSSSVMLPSSSHPEENLLEISPIVSQDKTKQRESAKSIALSFFGPRQQHHQNANDNDNEDWIGKSMEQTGKAFVVDEMARSSRQAQERSCISFNKYSGVQEWKNGLFLWVNLVEDSVNEFRHGGRQITWYGGSRMHDDTTVIRRLIQVGKAAAKTESSPVDSEETNYIINNNNNNSNNNSNNNNNYGVLLWCRTLASNNKGFGPYVCLGRLSYESHQIGSRPLAFVWNLLDYDLVVKNMTNDRIRKRMLHG